MSQVSFHLYTWEKQYERAERLLREGLGIYTKILPAGALNTAIAQVKLGRALLGQKRYRDAEPYSLAGYKAIKGQASPSIEYVRSAASDLIKIYSGLNLQTKAAQFQTEVQVAAR